MHLPSHSVLRASKWGRRASLCVRNLRAPPRPSPSTVARTAAPSCVSHSVFGAGGSAYEWIRSSRQGGKGMRDWLGTHGELPHIGNARAPQVFCTMHQSTATPIQTRRTMTRVLANRGQTIVALWRAKTASRWTASRKVRPPSAAPPLGTERLAQEKLRPR
eukprot:scaffold40046_cov29-Tisochrysis_lutea.AAC.2